MGSAGTTARTRRWLCGGSLILALAAPAAAEAAPSLVKVGDYAQPVYATGAPGDPDRVFVVQRPGYVMLGSHIFLDVSAEISIESERGLLSMAFAPDYATSRRFFVFLTLPNGDLQVREYRAASADAADPASGRALLTIPHRDSANHNGGQLQFGPDGLLWVSTGDGGSTPQAASDPASMLGKIIKLDVNTGVATIAAAGLRNPWRFSFAPDGRIVIADVGANEREEINVGLAANYGWPCMEGTWATGTNDPRCASGTAAPVLEKTHAAPDSFTSITGGYVVRDPGLPTLQGRYLYGDFGNPALRSVDLANPASDAPVGLDVPQLTSFGEDMCGRLFVVSYAGPVYRLVDGAPSACSVAPPAAPPGPPAVAPDTRACVLRMSSSGTRSVRRLKRLTFTLRTDETCRATVRASIRGVGQFKRTTATVTAGKRRVVRAKLTAHGHRAVRKALRRHKSLRVTVRVSAVDASGNARTLTRTLRIRG